MRSSFITKLFILFFFCFLSSNVLFARAGGGGRGGGGGYGGGFGGYSMTRHGHPLTPEERRRANIGIAIVAIIFIGYPAVISYLYFTKGPRNKKKINKRKDLDDFWDHDKLINYSKEFYHEVQKHWSTGSLKAIEEKLTPSLYRQQQSILNRYKKIKMYNRVEDITIEKAVVIYFDDYIDNSKDSVAIMIEGEMKDFFGRKEDGKNFEKESFRDAFVFIRKGNELLLNEIINEPDKYEMAMVKNSIE